MTDNNGIPAAWAALMNPSALRKASDLSRRADTENVLPPRHQIFRALELTPPDNVRCVILGQDPYHTPGVANGLAFSANAGCKVPPSLRNIFKELCADIGCPAPTSPDLTPWAEQGVLLLNTILTVRPGDAGSHAGWGGQMVTTDLLRVCAELPQPVMFLLWGRHAQKAGLQFCPPLSPVATCAGQGVCSPLSPDGDISPQRGATSLKHFLCSSHPSPLGASKASATVPAFLGNRPFSKTNAFLRASGAVEISWRLP